MKSSLSSACAARVLAAQCSLQCRAPFRVLSPPLSSLSCPPSPSHRKSSSLPPLRLNLNRYRQLSCRERKGGEERRGPKSPTPRPTPRRWEGEGMPRGAREEGEQSRGCMKNVLSSVAAGQKEPERGGRKQKQWQCLGERKGEDGTKIEAGGGPWERERGGEGSEMIQGRMGGSRLQTEEAV